MTGRVLGAAILAVVLAMSAPASGDPVCDPATVTLMAASGAQTFRVEIADEPAEQARGLMFRPSMPADAGMLFIFDPPRPASFWMENTMLPLDMVFIDDTGRVESIAVRADTYSRRVSASQGPVRAVLEINAGLSQELGIAPGTQAVHAAFRAAPDGFNCPD
ncbi:MAG TPA: DUF192 domain-containing protein [Thermohalobaculum sp.]|nr:DUF192 domain-containing protein [Thermohalobaculum sp.]